MRLWPTIMFAAVALALAACGATAPGHPPIWRIADADSEIWLFGTVHVLPEDIRWRSPDFEAAFAASEELVTEADVSDAGAGAALVARYGTAPENAPLSSRLTPETRVRLERVTATLNQDPAQFEQMRPWLASLRLSHLYAVSRGQLPAAGVEAVLVPEAAARGKRLSYLETPEQQIRTLAELSETDQIRLLELTLHEIERGGDTLEATQEAWAEGNLARLERLLQRDLRQAGPGPYAALITERNAAWSAAIKRRLAGSGRTLYAVGAAHLVGEDSVVALLRQQGVDVEGP